MFDITEGTKEERARMASLLPHLDELDKGLSSLTVTAWVTVWKSSAYRDRDPMEFCYTILVPEYPLMEHVAEVTELGVLLAEYRKGRWSEHSDPFVLIPALILHDVDKPLLYARQGERAVKTELAAEIPHGVLGGFLLRELGFDERVVSLVTTHAANSPFHSATPEGWMLHYADFYSADHAIMNAGEGVKPFYQRHWVS